MQYETIHLDKELPLYLTEAIQKFIEGQEKLANGEKYLQWDCDADELMSCINVAEVDQIISSEYAWYLRGKYLGLKQQTSI